MKKCWVFDPHSGGVRIPPAKREEVRERIECYAAQHYAGRYTRLDVRFRGALCYIDAFQEPQKPTRRMLALTKETEEEFLERMRAVPIRLGRLRYFGDDRWSYAFFTYSNEKYEPTILSKGWFGTPEEAFKIGATYLVE